VGVTHPENPGHELLKDIHPGEGTTMQRVECPRCNEEFGNLPNHLRTCNGGEIDA